MPATLRDITVAHPGPDYCHLIVFNQADLSDSGAKTMLRFVGPHDLTGLEQQALCAKIANATACLPEMLDAVELFAREFWRYVENDDVDSPDIGALKALLLKHGRKIA